MSEQDVRTTADWYFSDEFQQLLSDAITKPSRARFEAVGRSAVEFRTTYLGSPRAATSQSVSEPLVDKENVGEAVVYHHTLADHLGEPHGSDSCKELESNPNYVSDYIGDDV